METKKELELGTLNIAPYSGACLLTKQRSPPSALLEVCFALSVPPKEYPLETHWVS